MYDFLKTRLWPRFKIPKTNIDDTVRVARGFASQGIPTALSRLAIIDNDPRAISREIEEHIRALDLIKDASLRSVMTLTVHQFGLYKSNALAEESVRKIVEHAHRLGQFVWIDMERSPTVDATINIAVKLHNDYRNIGICLQAYLKRTQRDLENLLLKKIPVRLVKGYYKEHDFKDWASATRNFEHLMKSLLLDGFRPAIATHDVELLEKAKLFIRKHNIPDVEFQFFHGVRDEYAVNAVREGFNVRLYIPWGNFLRYIIKGFWTFDNWRNVQRVFGKKQII